MEFSQSTPLIETLVARVLSMFNNTLSLISEFSLIYLLFELEHEQSVSAAIFVVIKRDSKKI